MKKKIVKRFLVTGGLLMTVSMANPFGLIPTSDISIVVNAAAPDVAVPYADVIVVKYRVNNGHLEKRRWNQTKGVWVDPAWIIVK